MTASAGVDDRVARLLEYRSPAQQTAISMAIVDVADGPTATCIEACEARALLMGSCGTPSPADPATTGGSLAGVAVKITHEGCDFASKVDAAMLVSVVDGGGAASNRSDCNDVPTTAVSVLRGGGRDRA